MRATLCRLARVRSPRLIGGKYWSLLMKAAYYDREDEMRDLFAKGADIHARDWDGLTALHWAAGEGHARIVRLLLRCGADVNATDHEAWTALHRAAWKGHDRIIAPVLMDAGADITALTREGDNALHTASRFGHAAAARALLKAGADADSRNGMGKTPLAMSAGREVDLVFRDHSQ